jgi:hypothetical protein
MLANFTATVMVAGSGTINNSASLTIGTPPVSVAPTSLNLTVTPLSINITGQATVTITATDSGGNPAYNTPIVLDFQAGSTLGGFDVTLATKTITQNTDASGQLTATFYAGGSSGTATLRATATAPVPTIVKTASVTITSVPSSVSVSITPATINTSGTANIVANVLNSLSQPVPDGTVVNFSCLAGCGVGTFPATGTTYLGDASITFTASPSTAGTAVIQASAGSAPNVATGTASITVTAAVTSSIEFVSAALPVIGIQGSGPNDNTAVTFLVKDSNGTAKGGVPVNFVLYGPTGSYIGSTPGSTTDSASSGSDGKVSTILHAGLVAGPVRIVATVTGTTISTSSGNLSIGGGVPSATHFDLATNKFNLEGFGYNNIQATITAYLADRFGNYNVLQGTSVSFFTEAGAIDTSSVTDANGLTSATFRTQDPRPADVVPLLGEPSYTVGGHTYNPHDGWVTILVTTTGEETFVDNNANGVYDLGTDTFIDIGEPFIDANDNGVHNTGELFFDWPSYVPGGIAGTYQIGNGTWDGQIPIWKTMHLVFTGPPDIGVTAAGILTSRIECTDPAIAPLLYGDVTIPKGESRTFNVYVSDINMNTLIADTTIDVKQVTGAKGALTSPTPITLPDVLSQGPTVFQVRLLNNISDTTPQIGDFYVEVIWKGLKTQIYYPGAITLAP